MMVEPAFPERAVADFAQAYPEHPCKLDHKLVDHELLRLESLVELAARLDPSHVEYNPGDLPIGIRPEDVPTPKLSIADTIRSIEENGSWLVMKFIENDPAYKALLENTLNALRSVVEPRTGEMLTLQGFIFVSSPKAVTPFHFDPEHNILMQIRGKKYFHLFPHDDDRIVAATAHERYHLGEHHRNLEWDSGFERAATTYILEPGDSLHVPVKAPHWVQVANDVSISLSVTWRSDWSYKEADARALNHMLRKVGITPAPPGRWPAQNSAKSVAYRALRKVGLVSHH